jgi:hypothetical protein
VQRLTAKGAPHLEARKPLSVQSSLGQRRCDRRGSAASRQEQRAARTTQQRQPRAIHNCRHPNCHSLSSRLVHWPSDALQLASDQMLSVKSPGPCDWAGAFEELHSALRDGILNGCGRWGNATSNAVSPRRQHQRD